MIQKYPIEIEFTNNCWLRCISCISKKITNKWFLEENIYDKILNFLVYNHSEIEYITLWWLWDNFLHPKILEYLDKLKLLGGYNMPILIPTKWINFNIQLIDKIIELKKYWLDINIQIWIFSLKKELFNSMYWKMEKTSNKIHTYSYYEKFISFIKLLKAKQLDFSLELLLTRFSENEVSYFWKFCHSINVDWVIHRLHNFWWKLKTYNILYTANNSYNAFHCSYNKSLENNLKDYYHDKCWFFPYIDFEWTIYPWTFCTHYAIWNISNYSWTYIELVKKCYQTIDLKNKYCSKCIDNPNN